MHHDSMDPHWHAAESDGRHSLVDAWELGILVPSRRQMTRMLEALELPDQEAAEFWALWEAAVAEAEGRARPQG